MVSSTTVPCFLSHTTAKPLVPLAMWARLVSVAIVDAASARRSVVAGAALVGNAVAIGVVAGLLTGIDRFGRDRAEAHSPRAVGLALALAKAARGLTFRRLALVGGAVRAFIAGLRFPGRAGITAAGTIARHRCVASGGVAATAATTTTPRTIRQVVTISARANQTSRTEN